MKFNIKYCWKYIKSGDEVKQFNVFICLVTLSFCSFFNLFFQNTQPGSGSEDLGIDLSGGNIPHFSDSQVSCLFLSLFAFEDFVLWCFFAPNSFFICFP